MYRLARRQLVDRHPRKDAGQRALLPAKVREVTEDEERTKVRFCHASLEYNSEGNKQKKELWRDAVVRHRGLPARPTLFIPLHQAASLIYPLPLSTHLRFPSHLLPIGPQLVFSQRNNRTIM